MTAAAAALDHAVHAALASDCVYGPVPSRRYGTTLGLNLLPAAEKTCTLRCTYCQLGPEKRHHGAAFPTVDQYATELERALRAVAEAGAFRGHALDALVLSGNGDATMHPRLGEAVQVTLDLRDRWAAGVPVVLLTGATELVRPGVRAAVARLDEVAVKLDAGTQQTFERLDMPWEPMALHDIVAAAAQLPNAVVQTLLVHGSVDNTVQAEIEPWLQHVAAIRPRRVDLHTLDRKPIEKKLRPVPLLVTQALARRVERELGIAARAFAGSLND
jgi:wyosine [tRNA(Phe)-imidazoG37] synthetase (radical SAM superfamily)